MSIKYNERGEVISVNGLTTGHHLGAPMQDALAEKPEHNEAYAKQKETVRPNNNHMVDEEQPVAPSGGAVSWNDIKDKPFYTGDPVETVLFENSSMQPIQEELFAWLPEDTFAVEAGETYTVTFDGEKYKCVAWSPYGSESAPFLCVIGNSELIPGYDGNGYNGSNGEPFSIMRVTDDGILMFVAEVDIHSIVISKETPEVHKIDEKYLPEIPVCLNLDSLHSQWLAAGDDIIPNNNSLWEKMVSYGKIEDKLFTSVSDGFQPRIWYNRSDDLVGMCKTTLHCGSKDLIFIYWTKVYTFNEESNTINVVYSLEETLIPIST